MTRPMVEIYHGVAVPMGRILQLRAPTLGDVQEFGRRTADPPLPTLGDAESPDTLGSVLVVEDVAGSVRLYYLRDPVAVVLHKLSGFRPGLHGGPEAVGGGAS